MGWSESEFVERAIMDYFPKFVELLKAEGGIMSMISAKGQEHVKIEAKIPEDIDIAFKKYLWLLDMTLDEGIRQAILHYMEYLDKQVELVKKGKTLESLL